MPLFDYKCPHCNATKEALVKSIREAVSCTCGYIMQKQIPTKTGFALKGDGWFKDGYK